MFPGGLPMPDKSQQNIKVERETEDSLAFKPKPDQNHTYA